MVEALLECDQIRAVLPFIVVHSQRDWAGSRTDGRRATKMLYTV